MTRLPLRVVLLAVVSVTGILGATTVARATATPSLPPNGVYTCAWIADHPADAASAGVTCSSQAPPIPPNSPSTFPETLNPIAAVAPLDQTVCGRLPAGTTRVGEGVFAWTQFYVYSNYWDINGYVAYNYTWYVQKTDGTNKFHELVTDAGIHGTPPDLPANNYRAGAQNHASVPVYWVVCYVHPQ